MRYIEQYFLNIVFKQYKNSKSCRNNIKIDVESRLKNDKDIFETVLEAPVQSVRET